MVYQAEPKASATTIRRPVEGDQRGQAHAPRVLDERNRYLMYSMMQDVIRRGTATKGTRARTQRSGWQDRHHQRPA